VFASAPTTFPPTGFDVLSFPGEPNMLYSLGLAAAGSVAFSDVLPLLMFFAVAAVVVTFID